MNSQTLQLTREESTKIERLHYICESYKNFISILAREYSETKSHELELMIDKYRIQYQNYNIEFNVNVRQLLNNQFNNKIPSTLHYNFLFDESKVELTW